MGEVRWALPWRVCKIDSQNYCKNIAEVMRAAEIFETAQGRATAESPSSCQIIFFPMRRPIVPLKACRH